MSKIEDDRVKESWFPKRVLICFHRLILVFILTLNYACEEAIDWDQKGEFIPRLVVEGFITNQPGYNYVLLQLPVETPGKESRAVQGAHVTITDGTNTITLLEDDYIPGIYITPENIRAVVNKRYTLRIEAVNRIFTAAASMVPVGEMAEFSFTEVASNENHFRINPWNGTDPCMTRFIVDWSDETGLHQSVFYHYNLTTVDVNQFFKPAQEDLTFPSNSRIIRQKYSLSPDHERYLRSMLSETEWKGGWFDVLPGNLHTNLSQGGVGYFAASSMIIDTVFFEKN